MGLKLVLLLLLFVCLFVVLLLLMLLLLLLLMLLFSVLKARLMMLVIKPEFLRPPKLQIYWPNLENTVDRNLY